MAATSRSAGIDSSNGYFFGSARCVVAKAALCTTRTAEGKLCENEAAVDAGAENERQIMKHA